MDAGSHGNMWDNNDPIQTWEAQWAWRDKQGHVWPVGLLLQGKILRERTMQ